MVRRLIKIPKSQSILLLGPRGTGKSTLLHEVLEGLDTSRLLWVDLLRPESEEEYSRSPGLLRERVLGGGITTVVIDEVQKVPELLDVAHELIEAKKVRFLLSGSSARKLKRGGANLLAGRAIAVHLDAFSCLELGEKFRLQEALEFGFLPQIHFPDPERPELAWAKEEKIAFLQSYARTYLKEEIQLEQHVRKIQPFRNFLEIAAQANGKLVEYSNIARDTGVDHKTVAEYFQILEDTLIGFFLQPYHRSFRKRQGRKPKFYFFDTGVKRALDRTLTVPLLPQTSAFGETFEHFVILEFRKQVQARLPDTRLSFYREHDGSLEVDLIVEVPGEIPSLVEIKSGSRVTQPDLRRLARIGAQFGECRLFVLCQETEPRVDLGVSVLPWKDGIQEILFGNVGRMHEVDATASEAPVHPWRLCPYGEHWVGEHKEKIPPSKAHPSGSVTTRHAHCAKNPSGLDQLYPAEIAEIASRNFSKLKIMPCSIDLGFKGSGSSFDNLIAGWVQYWNEVLRPDVFLEPNLIKALISTESGFRPAKLANKKNQNSARGLMQITNGARKIIGDENGELKDHFVTATRLELNDPNVNICAGVRWLFRMRRLTAGLLGRSATWEEAVWQFKGLNKTGVTKKEREKLERIFTSTQEALKKCGH